MVGHIGGAGCIDRERDAVLHYFTETGAKT